MPEKTQNRRPGRRRPARTATALGAVLLTGALAVSGCGSAGESAGVSADSVRAEKPAAVDEGAAEGSAQKQLAGPEAGRSDANGPDTGTADTAQAAERHVIRTATLTVETKDVQGGLDEARTAVTTAGGYVSQETTGRDSDGEERSRVTFKVPPEEYDGVLDTLAGIGELTERKATAKDVTGEVVDVESRIRTQQASVARIRELMDDATELSDVVTLESELSTRQADLEALQARLKSLESRSGMATVTLELRTPDAAPVDEDEDTTVGDAVSGGWEAFVSVLKWIAIGIGASLPFVVALALLFALVRAVWGRVSRHGAVSAPAPAEPPEPLGAPAKAPAGDRD